MENLLSIIKMITIMKGSKLFFIIFLVSMIFSLSIFQMSANPLFAHFDNLDRNYDPIILTGNNFLKFLLVSDSNLLVYRYIGVTGTWERIPFQIDDIGNDGSYFSESDGILDSNDELVFMAKDMGDKAPYYQWISDSINHDQIRYEIEVTDSLNEGKHAWVYFYRSESIQPTTSVDYISAIADSDKITSHFYLIGHNSEGIMDELRLQTGTNGFSNDILDRQKFRVKGKLSGMRYEFTDNALRKNKLFYKDGPVRVVRELTVGLSGILSSVKTSFTERFYETFSVTGGGAGTLSSEYGVLYMRQSYDLNGDAKGMYFYNNNNQNGVLIDGIPDNIDLKVPSPGLSWGMFSGIHGSFLQLLYLPDIGRPQLLYYRDDSTGGTSDDTWDTGDKVSYGDVGIQFLNPVAGTYAMGYTTIYLPANLTVEDCKRLVAKFEHPLDVNIKLQQKPAMSEIRNIDELENFILLQNYPNPFNRSTTIEYNLPEESKVQLQIFNLEGKVVKTLINSRQIAFFYSVIWRGVSDQNLPIPSGIYYCILRTENFCAKKKIILLK